MSKSTIIDGAGETSAAALIYTASEYLKSAKASGLNKFEVAVSRSFIRSVYKVPRIFAKHLEANLKRKNIVIIS